MRSCAACLSMRMSVSPFSTRMYVCIASPIRRAGGSAGGAALSSGEGVSASGSMAVCTICAAGIAGSGAAGVAGMGCAGAENTGSGVTRGAAKADAVGERSAAVSSAGAAGA